MAQIVIVEDEAAVARVVAHYLRQAGHEAVVAVTGAAALQAAAAGPDLILLDLGLPDLKGAEVLRRLKRAPATAPIPVVIVSGEPDPAACVADRGPRTVAAILRKPVRCQELCEVVDAVLHTDAGSVAAAAREAPAAWAPLLDRVLTEGSNLLVRQVCRRLAVDHPGRLGSPAGPVASWPELARAGCQEGLLSTWEGTLLATPAGALAGVS
jgi:CheY-like chemotaxis protein